MSDLRFDPVTHQWVSIAENRRNRPVEFAPVEQARHQVICPFCAGNEDETPPALEEFDANLEPLAPPDTDEANAWSVRVAPNKYPAFEGEGIDPKTNTGPFRTANDFGVQELIIPTPRHVSTIGELEDEELKRAFHVARLRIANLKETDGIEHAMLFLNCRMEAGASIEHTHFQLLGSPILSRSLESRVQISDAYYRDNHQSLVQRIVEWEISQNKRVVRNTENFSMFCPFASRQPLTVWIAPVETPEPFVDSEHLLDELTELCLDAVNRIETLLERPAYNLLLHQQPFSSDGPDHWYVEIFPRMATQAGYEWGTDFWVNPVAPETAAKRFRAGGKQTKKKKK